MYIMIQIMSYASYLTHNIFLHNKKCHANHKYNDNIISKPWVFIYRIRSHRWPNIQLQPEQTFQRFDQI